MPSFFLDLPIRLDLLALLNVQRLAALDHYPLHINDATASNRIAEAFRNYFSSDRVKHTGPSPASEDFGRFGTSWHVPSVYWFVGGNDPEVYAKARAAGTLSALPVNHSPQFAPVLHHPSNWRRGAGRRGVGLAERVLGRLKPHDLH